jgi:hypothetical protein
MQMHLGVAARRDRRMSRPFPTTKTIDAKTFRVRIRVRVFYDGRVTAQQFVLATDPSRPTTSNFIFHLNTCGYSRYVTCSLMRGWVCRLQLLLVLASAVILRSESRGTHDHILLS